jgi:hypothetical protein
MTTYGQMVDGKRITLNDFEKQVREGVSGIVTNLTSAEIAKRYRKGESVDNAVSYFIIHN